MNVAFIEAFPGFGNEIRINHQFLCYKKHAYIGIENHKNKLKQKGENNWEQVYYRCLNHKPPNGNIPQLPVLVRTTPQPSPGLIDDRRMVHVHYPAQHHILPYNLPRNGFSIKTN